MTRTLISLATLSLIVAACGGSDEGNGSSDNGSGGSGNASASGSTESGGGGDDTSSTTGDPGSGSGGESTTTGPASSSAGTGGSPAMGACTNDADQQILMSQDVEALVQQCAEENFGQEPGTKNCIKESTQLSDPCVECFDQTVQCSVENCIGDCLGGQSPECDACVDTNCMPAFAACSGLMN